MIFLPKNKEEVMENNRAQLLLTNLIQRAINDEWFYTDRDLIDHIGMTEEEFIECMGEGTDEE